MKTEYVFLIDESGSMSMLKDQVISNYNSFMSRISQKKNTLLTTVFFNEFTKVIHNREELASVRSIELSKYQPKGLTALYDALADTLLYIDACHRVSAGHEKFMTKVFIITDGLENASMYYDRNAIKRLFELQGLNGWEFTLAGLGVDKEKMAQSVGGSEGTTMFDCNGDVFGVTECFENILSTITKD